MRAGAGEASAREAARRAAARLEHAGVPEPVASAEVLLSELLGVGRAELAASAVQLTAEQASLYEAWISRRMKREPVQRILGYAYFRNLVLDLNEETLIPRPDTESVVDAALERIDSRGYPCVVLDVGTGSGAIAISIAQERPRCEVHATDISEAALEISRQNAARNNAAVTFHNADVASGLHFLKGSIDLLVSNPPYVDEISASQTARARSEGVGPASSPLQRYGRARASSGASSRRHPPCCDAALMWCSRSAKGRPRRCRIWALSPASYRSAYATTWQAHLGPCC